MNITDVNLTKILGMCETPAPRPELLIREEFIRRAQRLIDFLSPTGGDVDEELYGEDLFDMFLALERAVRFSATANAKLQRRIEEENAG